MPFSHISGRPSFRTAAVNAVAMVPLLSTDKEGHESDSYSSQAFVTLMKALERYSHRDDDTNVSPELEDVDIQSQNEFAVETCAEDLLLVVPNSQLTRPGNWRYDSTPLKSFHWGHGCQRLLCFDGRPHRNRMAHDRIINPTVARQWIDLVPSRRTAAVIGILNMRDCRSPSDLHRAEQELHQWSERYSAPPYEVTFHGRSFARDEVVQRLFVFDSFHDSCREIDLSKTKLGNNLVAFPPSDPEHVQMMDLHISVMVNDLAVAIFQQLETKIKESDALCKEKGGGPDSRVKTHSLLNAKVGNDEPISKGANLSVANIANVVSPANKLASSSTSSLRASNPRNPIKGIVESASRAVHASNRRHTPSPQLLTPLDDVWDLSELNPRDAEAMKKRDVGRREKLAADLSLLAGSPMDAYERYSRAAEMCKASPDPLWYAASLEGCAAAHIAMAEAGGYNCDEYLESNFQLPEEFMALASTPSQVKQPNKQTLPTVVFALCEEALCVTNRHDKLAPLQAELLLKLASYVAEVEEAHMRCRWGEGEGCYGGDHVNTGRWAKPRRWDRTSVSQLSFSDLKGKDGEDLVASNTLGRCQKWTELLHRAASTGALPPLTRADVAATCARMCLRGMVPTQWKNNVKKERIIFPRKAAFFATVAADAISQCRNMESILCGSEMWLAASQFYSRTSNADGAHDYGWATLRVSVLHALSQQEDKVSSEAGTIMISFENISFSSLTFVIMFAHTAVEMLLALLCEITLEKETPTEKVDLRASLKALDRALELDDPPISGGSKHSSDGTDDRPDPISSRYSSHAKPNKSMSFRSSFYTSPAAAHASLLTVAQAKWAEDDPIPHTTVPLTGMDQDVISLSCVLPNISLDRCAAAQKRCIFRMSELRREMPTISSSLFESKDPHYAFSLSGDIDKGEPVVPPPLRILSAIVVPSESHLLVERGKGQGNSGKGADQSLGSMATFFNPYDSKNQGDKPTLVAEGEERKITIVFCNRLAIPLDVPSCEIEFNNVDTDRIKAPALSFVIPPKAKEFAVNFPFIMTTSQRREGSKEKTNGSNVFEVKGLRVTCLSRSYFIPLGRRILETADVQVPESASVYQRRVEYDSKRKEKAIAPRVEVVPAQPKLQLSFKGSGKDIADGTTVPVHLADGEIYTIPSFRIQNDAGLTRLGTVERLQIVVVGLPGLSDKVLPDEIIFDTDKLVASDGQDNEMEKDGLPPLKMKALCNGLSLANINDSGKRHNEGSTVTFQIAAMNDMGNHVVSCSNVRIRFRYRGVSSDPTTEIWRKREVRLDILRVKGPRISSLAFRPDLSRGSAYTELCMSLVHQTADYNAIKKEFSVASDDTTSPKEDNKFPVVDDSPMLTRVGMDPGVHVASSDVVMLMALANETDFTIMLSNRNGLVGGFEGSPMPTMRVASGVSVNIPVTIPRIKRVNDKEGGVRDIVSEIVSLTSLRWESASNETDGGSDTRKVRQGQICIPSSCLRDIIAEHQSFLSRICEPPVSVKVNIGRKEAEQNLFVSPGTPVDVFMEVETAGKI